MDRYDRGWGRGYSAGGGASYDRGLRYDAGWWGGGRRGWWDGPPPRPQRFAWGYGRDFGPGGGDPRSPYHSGPGRGYGAGWERYGPPGGYGAEWGAAYGNYPARGRPRQSMGYDDFAGPRGGPGEGAWFERYGPSRGYDSPGFPTRYFDDDLDFDDHFDDDFDDDLDGGFGPAGQSFGQRWSGEPNDDDVRRSVSRSLHEDGFIEAAAIQVEVKERVVTLRGQVKDYMEARYAWDDAWEAPGVRGVISKLTVEGSGRQESPPGAARKEVGSGKGKGSRGASKD
jgi:hypothetical protein